MEVHRLEADLAARMAPWIELRPELDRLLVEFGHAALETLDGVVGEHPELGLGVCLGEVLTQPQGGQPGLETQRELRQGHGTCRGRPSQERQGDTRNDEPKGGVDKVGLEVDAAALGPDAGKEFHTHIAVVVGEPAGQAEDADLLAGRRVEGGGSVVVRLATH